MLDRLLHHNWPCIDRRLTNILHGRLLLMRYASCLTSQNWQLHETDCQVSPSPQVSAPVHTWACETRATCIPVSHVFCPRSTEWLVSQIRRGMDDICRFHQTSAGSMADICPDPAVHGSRSLQISTLIGIAYRYQELHPHRPWARLHCLLQQKVLYHAQMPSRMPCPVLICSHQPIMNPSMTPQILKPSFARRKALTFLTQRRP